MSMERIKSLLLRYKYVIIIALGFFALYSLISLVNNYYFRTYAFDLGIRNNAMFDYTHFKWNQATVLYPYKNFDNVLGDHFCLLPIIVSPFRYLFGSYTLLIFQILAIIWGGIGIFKYVKLLTNSKLGYIAQIHFYVMWGVFSALSFDYHDNVIAAMLVPWVFYYFKIEKFKLVSIYTLLILISKENMPLWAFFIFFGLFIHFWNERKKRNMAAIFALVSIVFFIILIKWLMPVIGGGAEYQHNSFTALGNSFSDVIMTVLTRPAYVFSLLFEIPPNAAKYLGAVGIKTELHLSVLLAGGIFLIRKPQFLIMLIPIYGQKLFNNDFVKWGVNLHYSIEFVPIITIAVYHFIKDVKIPRTAIYLAVLFMLINLGSTISLLDNRVSKYYSPVNSRFYQKQHYNREFNLDEVRNALKMIPNDASLSAHTIIVPKMAFREKIYSFPYVADAEYIFLINKPYETYPLNKEDYLDKIAEYKSSKEWLIFYESDDVLIFKRKE